ncbi:hypothetical protein HGRIS_010212 [Hohenbuehelia grisea]|uniref:CCHC-type domain-containing protein n=1 Tax=Hohenbuehelia grisea TaxID=104357 RepID=A0ABR3J3L1_9AGAR
MSRTIYLRNGRTIQPIPGSLTGESPITPLLPSNPPSRVANRSAVTDSESENDKPLAAGARRYSDVVAARVSRDGSDASTENPFDINHLPDIYFNENNDSETPEKPERPESDDDKEGEWTPVTHRKKKQSLDQEQVKAVKAAEQNLKPADKDLIAKRNQALSGSTIGHAKSASLGEGPSRTLNKGKGRDPAEWGGLDLSEAEKDPEAQAAALQNWNELRKHGKKKHAKKVQMVAQPVEQPAPKPIVSVDEQLKELRAENARLMELLRKEQPESISATKSKAHMAFTTPLSHGMETRINRIAGHPSKLKGMPLARDSDLQPSQQITSESYLGRAFAKVKKAHKGSSSPSDDSDSSSLSSDSPDSSSSSSESSSSSDHRRSRKRRSKKRHSKKKKSKTLIKPTPPDNYDGEANSQKFHKFMMEATSYVRDGHVKPRRQVATIARYLDDKAYNFYAQTVAAEPENWTLDQFFTEMFDYCFPVDFIPEQRRKLKRCLQHDKTVKEYVAELIELFTTIGHTDAREQVNKLWYGLRYSIQAGLWKVFLNPETSTWNEVVAAAEVITRSESVPDPSNQRKRHEPRASSSNAWPNQPPKQPNHQGNHKRHGGKRNFKPNQRFGNNFKPKGQNYNQQDSSSSRPKLSPQEQDELRAANKCFICKEVGHMLRGCPKANSMRSTSRGPPGFLANSISVDLDQTEQLRDLADSAEVLESLDLGSISYDLPFEHDSDTKEGCPEPRRALGDALSTGCQRAFERGSAIGYPGDEELKLDPVYEGVRFFVMQISDEECVITDHLQIDPETDEDTFTYVKRRDLRNPKFRLAHWYAVQCARRNNLHRESAQPMLNTEPVGYLLTDNAVEVLRSGVTYPGDADGQRAINRFTMWFGASRCQVHDNIANFHCFVPTACLENQKFDLISWYAKTLKQNYLEIHSVMRNNREDPHTAQFWRNIEATPDELPDLVIENHCDELVEDAEASQRIRFNETEEYFTVIELFGQQVQQGTYPAIQRNVSVTRDFTRAIPRPVVVVVTVNGQPARALIDSGSLGDFMSTTLADQLKISCGIPYLCNSQCKDPARRSIVAVASRFSTKLSMRSDILI